MITPVDFGARLLAAAAAVFATTAAMLTAIVPGSPATSMLIGGLA